MDWTRIIDAVNGRPQSLAWFVRQGLDAHVAVLATLLLLEEAPRPAAALAAAARMVLGYGVLPTHAALAPHVAPALATRRANPQWGGRVFGDDVTKRRFAQGVAGMVGALRELPAALRDAAAMVLRDGDADAIVRLLAALGAAGWTALEEDQRVALLKDAPAAALGRVWEALDEAQRAAATQRAESSADAAARLIGRIGAAAWRATDPALRERLIAAAVRGPFGVSATAPAWTGMTDDERARLATAVIARNDALAASPLLRHLGVAGRATLTVEQRAALERCAMESLSAWCVLAWRAADDGWGALTDEERDALMTTAEQAPWFVSDVLRAAGVAGWNAMRADERERLAAVVRRRRDALFACPPALWTVLAGANLPPTATIPGNIMDDWVAEDVYAVLGDLPAAHQTLVLACAPWRTEDAAPDSARMQRLRAAWDALPDDERVAFATERPSVLATVAAAARLAGGAAAVRDAVGETVARIATATVDADAKRVVGAMLRGTGAWRAWMVGFAPTDGDPSEVWPAWRRAARRGLIDDVTLCARLAAKEREEAKPARALRRA